MPTNLTKNSGTVTMPAKTGQALWADTVVTWGDSTFRWATDGFLPSHNTKSSVTIDMIDKS